MEQSMRTRKATRRAILTGVAAAVAPNAALPLPASADPTFATIERHRVGALAWMGALKTFVELEETLPLALRRSRCYGGQLEIVETDDPRWIKMLRAYNETHREMEEAATALANVVPTTRSGIVALLDHIDSFNRGALTTLKIGFSEHELWPEDLQDERVADGRGKPLKMPWPFWIMRNIQAALVTGAA